MSNKLLIWGKNIDKKRLMTQKGHNLCIKPSLKNKIKTFSLWKAIYLIYGKERNKKFHCNMLLPDTREKAACCCCCCMIIIWDIWPERSIWFSLSISSIDLAWPISCRMYSISSLVGCSLGVDCCCCEPLDELLSESLSNCSPGTNVLLVAAVGVAVSLLLLSFLPL